jgi:hypothetical protein
LGHCKNVFLEASVLVAGRRTIIYNPAHISGLLSQNVSRKVRIKPELEGTALARLTLAGACIFVSNKASTTVGLSYG